MNLVVVYTVLALSLGLILFVMASNRSHALKKDKEIKNEATNVKPEEEDATDLAN